jgi:hypothetical protein
VGESLLAGIARRSAGGIRSSATDPEVDALLAAQIRSPEAVAAVPTDRLPRYAWLAGAALLLLLVEPLGHRRRRRSER